MIEVSFFSALLGGILTFFAPCTLPLIPAYVGFLGGGVKAEESGGSVRRRILRNAVLFVLGFSLIFILAGVISGSLGKAYVRHHVIISQLSGVIILFFGLSMLDIIPLSGFVTNLLTKFFRVKKLPKSMTPGNPTSAFLLGVLFAIGLGPTCLGPILGYISLLAATSGTALYGALMLTVYSLGIAIPFLIVALLYGSSFSYIERLTKILPLINRISGLILIVIGILLIMVNFGMISIWMGHVLRAQWYTDLVNYM